MHLPWIKAKKVTRISRLVAELQSPSNRSSTSLVVETGFPASLLDLYMKNQNRLSKKSKKKKKQQQQQQQQAETFDATANTTTAAAGKNEKSNFSAAKVSEPVVSVGKEELLVVENFWGPTVSIIENCACPGEGIGGKKYDDVCERSRDGGAVVGSVMKVFVVVVLALGMKELAVGITMSAFVLFFLDYVGRRYGSSMRTILDFCGCSIQRVNLTPVLWIKERIFIQRDTRESFDQVDGDGTVSIAGSSFPFSEDVNFLAAREIEAVESSDLSSVCEITENRDYSMSNFDLSTRRIRWGSEEEVIVAEKTRDGVEVVEHKDDSGSRKKKKLSSKIIKKIVPKKLRKNKGNKSKENESKIKGEALCNVGGGSSSSGIDEQHEEKTSEGREMECMALTTLQNLLDLEDEADCEDENGKLCRYDELIIAGNALVVRRKSDSETKIAETITKSAEMKSTELKRTERRSNSSYLMLVPIALLGLLLSRSIAFLLVIVWCLALAFVGLIRRTKYVPMTL